MRDWKSIPKQKLLKENGEFGDCFRCCVAAIIGKPAEEVPHFIRDYQGCMADTQRWLVANHWVIFRGDCSGRDFNMPTWWNDDFGYPIMACGPTVRSKNSDETHVVVLQGGNMVYDPHPSEAGLLANTHFYLLVKFPDGNSPEDRAKLKHIIDKEELEAEPKKKIQMDDLKKATGWIPEQK